jgi:exonuclease 1
VRDESRRKAEEFLREGNKVMAHKFFSMAVDITPEMAFQLVQAAKQMSVQFIVAPYEADAQLAFMYL